MRERNRERENEGPGRVIEQEGELSCGSRAGQWHLQCGRHQGAGCSRGNNALSWLPSHLTQPSQVHGTGGHVQEKALL